MGETKSMMVDWSEIFSRDWKLVAIQYFGRSGSTLLHTLLDGHPSVLAFPVVGFQDFYPKCLEECLEGIDAL